MLIIIDSDITEKNYLTYKTLKSQEAVSSSPHEAEVPRAPARPHICTGLHGLPCWQWDVVYVSRSHFHLDLRQQWSQLRGFLLAVPVL